ncbi:hypothetical protein Cantr_06718 [Candida viswanathii]|uniref:HTH CENPB-type domain-containing protein n=1 Tax=Candida viswanathii TaxID=5486 RepID=A0A367XX82_9ASCO|nr:hypothetical protein Cantr_06718 [Candida viswanathii]
MYRPPNENQFDPESIQDSMKCFRRLLEGSNAEGPSASQFAWPSWIRRTRPSYYARSLQTKVGSSDSLKKGHEECLVRYIHECIHKKLGITRQELKYLASEIAKTNEYITIDSLEGWFQLFMERHPEFVLRKTRQSLLSILRGDNMVEFWDWATTYKTDKVEIVEYEVEAPADRADEEEEDFVYEWTIQVVEGRASLHFNDLEEIRADRDRKEREWVKRMNSLGNCSCGELLEEFFDFSNYSKEGWKNAMAMSESDEEWQRRGEDFNNATAHMQAYVVVCQHQDILEKTAVLILLRDAQSADSSDEESEEEEESQDEDW